MDRGSARSVDAADGFSRRPDAGTAADDGGEGGIVEVVRDAHIPRDVSVHLHRHCGNTGGGVHAAQAPASATDFLVPLPLLKFVWERALVHVSNALNQVECKVNYWKRH